MKKFQLIGFILFLLSSSLSAQQMHYAIDDAHSQVKFMGSLGSMMDVEGNFGEFWGDVFFDAERPDQLSVTIMIDPSSLDTDNEWRDKHLQDEDFLHTEKHDIIVFQSSQVTLNESLSGTLTLKGEEKPIQLTYQQTFGPDGDPWGNQRVTFTGSFSFSRSDFKLGPTEGFWGNSIEDEASLVFTISATRQNMDRMSMLKNEKVAAIWDNLANGNSTQAMEGIDSLIQDATEEEAKRIPRMIDLLAKRCRQYGHQESYLLMLNKNVSAFPELDWTHSHLALGLWESGKPEQAIEAAREALSLNPKNTLALELLKGS